MTDSSALRAFIEARLAEDEATARATGETGTWTIRHRRDWNAKQEYALENDCASGTCDCCAIEGSNGMLIYDEGGHDNDDAEHIARHDPARVLREVAAKRAILAEHTETDTADVEGHKSTVTWCPICNEGDCTTLCALASVWSDHPAFQAEWSTT